MVLMAIVGELGAGKCFTKDTLIGVINDGKFKLLTIGELFIRKDEFDELSVLSFDGNSLRRCRSFVIYKEPAKRVVVIRTRNKRELKLSGKHKLPIYRNGLKWVEASKLKEGDLLLVPSYLPMEDKEEEWGDISWVIGLYVAEGHNGVISNKDEGIIEKLCKITGKEVFKERRGCKYVKVGEWIERGLKLTRSREKYIPKHFFNNRNDAIKFIAGFFDGDGYFQKGENRIVFSSTSQRLLSQLSYLSLIHI